MIKVGSKAPDFKLKAPDGRAYGLADFKGKDVVLYFYPKDDTPGCTIEAKGFNKSLEKLRKRGADVIGISKDSMESHKKFCDKYSLRFLLLSDPDSKVIKKYGAYGDRGIFGPGTLRKTYIIDAKGKIAKIFDKVNPLGHDTAVMSALGK
ncbi:MAG: peroxiredoxin [Candidatus Micrarchaeaceae archaeon]